MAWTDPRTWVALELETAAVWNTHVRDNSRELQRLLTTNAGVASVTNNTTSTSYAAVPNSSLTFTAPRTGRVVYEASVLLNVNGGSLSVCVMDGVPAAVPGTDRLVLASTGAADRFVRRTLRWALTGLTGGTSYTRQLGWKVSAGTGYGLDGGNNEWALYLVWS